jgi:hypothetical protein
MMWSSALAVTDVVGGISSGSSSKKTAYRAQSGRLGPKPSPLLLVAPCTSCVYRVWYYAVYKSGGRRKNRLTWTAIMAKAKAAHPKPNMSVLLYVLKIK